MENAQQYETGPLKKTEVKTERKSGRRSKWSDLKVRVIPLPHYIGLASIIFLAAYFSKLPSDMIGGFAVIIILGMLLGDIGLKVPILKDIGGPAILLPPIGKVKQLESPILMGCMKRFMTSVLGGCRSYSMLNTSVSRCGRACRAAICKSEPCAKGSISYWSSGARAKERRGTHSWQRRHGS